MKKETLEHDIKEVTNKLLDLARKSCWNKISDDCVFILSEIQNQKDKDVFEIRRKRNKVNKSKIPKTLDQIISDLEKIYPNLYDINLHVYRALRKTTIIEIRYYPKSSLDKDYFQKVKDSEPMLHCKIAVPPYADDSKERFDINWELGGLRHFWKMIWWQKKMKKEFEKRKRWVTLFNPKPGSDKQVLLLL